MKKIRMPYRMTVTLDGRNATEGPQPGIAVKLEVQTHNDWAFAFKAFMQLVTFGPGSLPKEHAGATRHALIRLLAAALAGSDGELEALTPRLTVAVQGCLDGEVEEVTVLRRGGHITAGELAALAKLAPDAPVLVTGGPDHSYRQIRSAQTGTAAKSDVGFAEWAGPEHACEGERPAPALILD